MHSFRIVLASGVFALAAAGSCAAKSPCPRFAPGSLITAPADLYSRNGVLSVNFAYRTTVDVDGLTRFCFVTPDGLQSPTLHVRPGDQLVLNLKNEIAPTAAAMAPMPGMSVAGSSCTPGSMMTASSVNMHYHGTNVPPSCHQDEVITTMVNPGETFRYQLEFPSDEPPGLYWYHPHIHGMSEMAVLGGASGAIVVDGIENVNADVAGLPQRILVIRDYPLPGFVPPPGAPGYNLSLNYAPIPFPRYTAPVIPIKPWQKQFWRVLNASADTIIDMQIQYDGQPQTFQVVARDGVPTGSQDGMRKGQTIDYKHVLLPPAGRIEFIVQGPALTVQNAALMTMAVDTGPAGDFDPTRPLAVIKADPHAVDPPALPAATAPPPPARFADLASATPSANRKLFFSEVFLGIGDTEPAQFFITVAGQTPRVFNAADPPAIVTTQGAVEDWTIENRSGENHEFHIHQIHFLVLERDGNPVPDGQFLDTVDIPYWPCHGPYHSLKVRMDFRGLISGDFVYHCHILEHEDGGMMAIIRVLPK